MEGPCGSIFPFLVPSLISRIYKPILLNKGKVERSFAKSPAQVLMYYCHLVTNYLNCRNRQ